MNDSEQLGVLSTRSAFAVPKSNKRHSLPSILGITPGHANIWDLTPKEQELDGEKGSRQSITGGNRYTGFYIEKY